MRDDKLRIQISQLAQGAVEVATEINRVEEDLKEVKDLMSDHPNYVSATAEGESFRDIYRHINDAHVRLHRLLKKL